MWVCSPARLVLIISCIGRGDALLSHLDAEGAVLHDFLALANRGDSCLHLLVLIDSDEHRIEVFV